MHQPLLHSWLVAPYRQDREALYHTLKSTEEVFTLDCHRGLRGPYTAAGTLLRKIVPNMYQRYPDHVQAHAIEILSLAPELRDIIPFARETLTSLAIPEERTRFYSRVRTLRLAHGLVDFLQGCLSRGGYERLLLYFDRVQEADVLDRELIEVLLRRADPRTLRVVVGTTSDPLPQALEATLTTHAHRRQAEPFSPEKGRLQLQSWHVASTWQDWLLHTSMGWIGEWEPLRELPALLERIEPVDSTFIEGLQFLVEHASPEERERWARAYIEADGTSENLLEIAAYQSLDETTRQQWHDKQAELLEQKQQWSLHLGAIPYHRERGQNPSDKGARALQDALDYCINMGYYEATIDFGHRGRAIITWETQLEYYWVFTTKMTTSLAALERGEEAEPLYNEARALTVLPMIHMQAAYATAMLYARHFPPERRDYNLAKGWINQAIGIASLLPHPKERAFHTVFNQNGLALIELRLGNAQEALRLVTEGLKKLDAILEPGEQRLHRSVLVYNRAQVYERLGQYEQAILEYTSVIEQDPYYSEYYFERGNIYRRLERNEEALADYQHAIAYSPPYPEAYYNRAGVLSVFGRDEEALADYSYVLELEPDHLDALLNRATLLYERGDYTGARRDVAHGLHLNPENAHLLCTLGLLEMVAEHPTEAFQALTCAIEQDPSLIEAWTNRAILEFETGQVDAAIHDLTQAIASGKNAAVLYNRGIAYQYQERWDEAIQDFTAALALDCEDEQDLLVRLAFCRLQVTPTNLK